MASVVSSLSVVIGADISGFTQGASTVSNKISSFGANAAGAMLGAGRAMQTFGGQVSNTGSQISALSQPFVDVATSGLEAASSFEDIMTQLETFGGLTGDELERVSDLALQLGADTKFSASDAAGAMLELVKSGMSVEEAMTATRGALDLAAAGNISLDASAGIVATTLAQFGLDAADAGDAANILAAAALASRADVGTLADGLSNVGPVANAAGLTLTDTAAALGVLSNAGISGAEAGTQLKSLLLNFNTDTAKGEFDDLGVSLYDAAGNTRDFDTVLDELKVSLDGMTPEQRAEAMKNLAGSYGVTALNALLAQGGIDSMKSSMDAAPTAADLAAKSMETFSGKTEGLKGSIETLMITGLTPLMENTLTPLVDKVTGVVNSITEWAAENPQLASTIGGIILGIGLLGSFLTVVGGAISLAGMAFSGLGAVIGLVTSPVGLLVLALSLLYGVVSNPDIQAGLSAWSDVFAMLPAVIEVAKNSINDFVSNITLSSIGDTVTDATNSILDFLGVDLQVPDFSAAIEGWQTGLEGIKAIIDTIGAQVGTAIQTMVAVAQTAINNFLGLIIKGQLAITDLQISLGINVEANQGFKQQLLDQLAGLQATGTVPGFLTGGTMPNDGLAYLHAGERVLNTSETSAYERAGSSSGGGQTVVINSVMSFEDILFEAKRRGFNWGTA